MIDLPAELAIPREYVYRALGIVVALILIFLAVRIASRVARRYVDDPTKLFKINRSIRRGWIRYSWPLWLYWPRHGRCR